MGYVGANCNGINARIDSGEKGSAAKRELRRARGHRNNVHRPDHGATASDGRLTILSLSNNQSAYLAKLLYGEGTKERKGLVVNLIILNNHGRGRGVCTAGERAAHPRNPHSLHIPRASHRSAKGISHALIVVTPLSRLTLCMSLALRLSLGLFRG